MKLKPWVRFVLLIIFLIILFIICPNIYNIAKNITVDLSKGVKSSVVDIVDNYKNQKKEQERYEKCLREPYQEEELTEELKNSINNLDSYINNNYRMSVEYLDITTGFNYKYNTSVDYYAASTIKLLDALYIYEKAADNIIDLDETVTYKAKDVLPDSLGMKQHDVGEAISLRTLVKYAIIYSDNSAHQMLINYIGFNNLKAFGNSLGAKLTLVGGDNFGNINTNDAIIYLKNVYDFIENNNELGQELKSYLLDAQENMIKYDGINVDVGHKYGYYDYYFNDLGIVYDENPYLIAVLTTHGKGKYQEIVNDISKKINELHQQFKENRQSICQKNKDVS